MSERYFEDFAVGDRFGSGRFTMDAEAIKAFARNFDPQPFHTDETAAVNSLFGGLVASGWHTAAATMRLVVDSELKIAGGLIGAGCEELRWPKPVHPGDTLHIDIEVVGLRPLQSRPQHGFVKIRTTTLDDKEEAVQVFIANLLVPRRPA